MPSTRKSVPGEKIAEAKHLYERTLIPTDDIAAMLGISRWTLQRRAKYGAGMCARPVRWTGSG